MAQTLPHKSEAEAALLGGVLLRNEAFDEVEGILNEEDFYVPAHRAVFRAMRHLREAGQAIDVLTLEHQLELAGDLGLIGGIEGLGALADRHTSTRNVASYARIVREMATVRRLVVVTREIADEGMGGPEDIREFVDGAERRILEVNQRGREGGYVKVDNLVNEVFANLAQRARAKNPITGVPTGYSKLDEMTGGMQPGDLVILAARPSMGKTALALNICQNAALRSFEEDVAYPVLFFSLEMSSAQLIERVLCSEARIDAGKIRSGSLTESDFAELIRAAGNVHKAPLFIDDSAAPTILEIRARARRFRQDREIFPPQEPTEEGMPSRPPLGLIVVDYLQLCRGGKGRYDSREQEISEISRGLKAIAKELKLPVLALSQLNRGVDSRSDHRPQLSDLRESGAIEQDADVIMFIYRGERYETDEVKRKELEGQAEVIIGKQRNGPTGTVHLTFVGKHTRFENPVSYEPPH